MALKFLNKKGWHTGSLRNIENVWKAEQKHDAEQKKLEELRKQIQEERERSEFRLLQERAGLAPRQERLDFLYESGLAVGRGSSDGGGFKALEAPPKVETSVAVESSSSKAAAPGALFEDKPQSANDAWRKLHSDPLLLIRQREQEALAQIKNNPIQMAMIRKSVEAEKKQKEKGDKKEEREKKEHKKKHRHSKSKHDKHSKVHSDSEDAREGEEERRDRRESVLHRAGYDCEQKRRGHTTSECHHPGLNHEDERRDWQASVHHRPGFDGEKVRRDCPESEHRRPGSDRRSERDCAASEHHRHGTEQGSESNRQETQTSNGRQGSGYNHRRSAPQLSGEERAARLREMQVDAELHEEQRWKRLKKASEVDAQEAVKDRSSGGRNFLDAAHKSFYGTEKGGSSTIEESVRRRTYYSQGASSAQESNAFRRQ